VRSRYGITVFGLMSPGEPFEYATPDTPVSAADGLVVVERSARSPEPSWPSDMAPTGQRALGDTRLWTATPVRLET